MYAIQITTPQGENKQFILTSQEELEKFISKDYNHETTKVLIISFIPTYEA